MRQLIIIAALACLTACGFRPVYGAPSSGAIQVENIPGRSGHALRKALLRDLAAGLPGVEEGATLSVNAKERLSQLAFQSDGAASRSNVSVSARYVLNYGDSSVSGSASSEAIFNVPPQSYGDIAAQVAASERAMEDLSRRIVEDLRIKLSKRAS